MDVRWDDRHSPDCWSLLLSVLLSSLGSGFARQVEKPCLDDDGDGQVHVVRVDQAHREARVPGKRAVHRALPQHLRSR